MRYRLGTRDLECLSGAPEFYSGAISIPQAPSVFTPTDPSLAIVV